MATLPSIYTRFVDPLFKKVSQRNGMESPAGFGQPKKVQIASDTVSAQFSELRVKDSNALGDEMADQAPNIDIKAGRGRLVYDKARQAIVGERTEAPETIEVNGVWYDRRDTVDALNGLLAEARAKIETYKSVIREYRQRDLAMNPTPPPAVSPSE